MRGHIIWLIMRKLKLMGNCQHKWGLFLVTMRILQAMPNTIEISIFWSIPSSSAASRYVIARIWSPCLCIQSFHTQIYFSPEDALLWRACPRKFVSRRIFMRSVKMTWRNLSGFMTWSVVGMEVLLEPIIPSSIHTFPSSPSSPCLSGGLGRGIQWKIRGIQGKEKKDVRFISEDYIFPTFKATKSGCFWQVWKISQWKFNGKNFFRSGMGRNEAHGWDDKCRWF